MPRFPRIVVGVLLTLVAASASGGVGVRTQSSFPYQSNGVVVGQNGEVFAGCGEYALPTVARSV
jgi:hypothetical protein